MSCSKRDRPIEKRFVFFVLLICCCLSRTAEATRQLNISASAAVLMDQQTGRVLWAKNPDWQRPMASLTKIMTAILVLERDDPKELVVISREAARTPGSSMYLRSGTTYRVQDLLYGLMLLSGNDAAVALAEHNSGSLADFVAFMNKKAAQLGALHTKFSNPHGLPDEGHYSTAYDMALLARYALSIPEFAHLVASPQAMIFDPIDAVLHPIYNKNRLLWEFDGANGVKTGYTTAAGRCLAASATRQGRQVVAVILDAPRLWEDADALLTYGLEEYRNVKVIQKGETVAQVNVEGGLPATTMAVSAQDVWITVPSSQVDAIEMKCVIDLGITAPIEQWAPLGRLFVKCDNQLLADVPLLAGEKVVARNWISLLRYYSTHMQKLLAAH